MVLVSDYRKKAFKLVLLNLRSEFPSEMYLTARSRHSSRGKFVKKLSIYLFQTKINLEGVQGTMYSWNVWDVGRLQTYLARL